MIMLRDVARRLPAWDGSVKLALGLAVALLLLLLALAFGGPSEIQFQARIGAFGLLVTLQILFLWANRRHVSPYHQAQQDFIAGDYQSARKQLEAIPESSRVSVDALVLLGNCYRHLGSYDSCGAALERALQIKPEHHLALFSRGKLSLVTGDYARAAEMISRALRHGSPQVVRFDLGQALYLNGEHEAASEHLLAARVELDDDPPQQLMIAHYLHALRLAEPPGRSLTQAGLEHWRREAATHAATAYGQALSEAVDALEKQLALA